MTRTTRLSGFTLIETLVVITIIGGVALALAATFSVIVRTAPSNEARTDDARALLGLTTWLPPDVMSTETDKFAVDPLLASGCGASIPGENLLELEWTEGSATFRSNYRYVEENGTHTIRRYACRVGGPTTELKLTADVAPIPAPVPSDPPLTPVHVTLKPAGGPYTGVQFDVIIVDDHGVQRELLSIDAFTENVPGTLPDLQTEPTQPLPVTQPNLPPVATNYTYQVHPDEITVLFVMASDPNGDPLTSTITSGPLWASDSAPLEISLAPTAANIGTHTILVEVADPEPLTAVAAITIEVVPTTSTTSTTSTPSTTTTSLPACVAAIQLLTPTSTSNATNKGEPTNKGKLVDEVNVAISSNGFCGPLVLEFDPDPLDPGVEFVPFNNAPSITLSKNLLWRDSDGTPHPLMLKQGIASTVVLDARTLTVN